MKKSKLNSIITLLFLLLSSNAFSTIYYVKTGSSGDGTSWESSFGTLQEALAVITNGDQIWVAAGTYKPSETNNRNHRYNIPSGVKIYGGFNGSETSISERDSLLLTNQTIFTGEIQDDDNLSNNSINIFSIKNSTSPVYLNSIIIEKGNSMDDVTMIFIDRFHALNIFNSKVFLENVKITGNKGGIFLYNSDVYMNSCFIENNTEAFYILNDNEETHIIQLSHSKINNNHNLYGGVFRAEMNPIDSIRLYSSEFTNNFSEDIGGGVGYFTLGNIDIQKSIFSNNISVDKGGVFYLNQSSIMAHDALFINNSAPKGGIISSEQMKKSHLINCTFSGNEADSNYNYFEFHNADSIYIVNCILDKSLNALSDFGPNSDSTFSPNVFFMNCLMADEIPTFWIDGGENITLTSPGFIGENNYNLNETSDAINKGNASFRMVSYLDDLSGSERISGDTIDIGCYEFYFEPLSIQENNKDILFELYPNPATDFLHIYLDKKTLSDSYHLYILDVNGKEMFSEIILDKNNHELKIDIQSFPKGIYFIQIKNQLHPTITTSKSFIKL